MKLGIDVVGALRPHTRAGRYTAEFVSALTRIDPGPEVVLFCNAFRVKDAGKVLGLGPPVVNPRIPGRVLLTAWRCLRWPPIDVLIGPVDGFHTSDLVHPPQRHGATVATVHDVGALVHPDWYAPDVVEVHRRKNEAAARNSDAIITGSEFTNDEFVRLHQIGRNCIHVVPYGVSSFFRPVDPDRARATATRHGLTGPFLLYVGTRERRKNLLGLMEIFPRLSQRRPDMTLALAGMRPWAEASGVHGAGHWSGQEVEARMRKLGIAGRVIVLGQVPLPTPRDLYSAAEAFVFPSYYEGFGLPALEAMACGVPVVASSRSALREVVGGAGVLVDPDEHEAFADAILRLMDEPHERERLRARGLKRAAQFTWESTARGTMGVCREAVGRE
ncbi:MAG TPA: glycosyltransferase family 1 protein [Gemmatimonadales bacterium]|nr:glycosyltransferase family 1 protein [Gemmatimonadales bacterium]